MKKNCEYCGKEFEAQRTTARFDTAACKLKFNRGEKQTAVAESDKLDKPKLETLPPKSEWFDAWTPVEPILDKFQPENGDLMCEDLGLLKGVYPKGKGTDLGIRQYRWHQEFHQETCYPKGEERKPVGK